MREYSAIIAVFVLLSLVITIPAYQDPHPAGHDWQVHFCNACEYALSVQNGIVVAHLTPNFFTKLGGINFKYYPPYSYLPVAVLVLTGVSVGTAFALALTLSFAVSGVGLYTLARLRFSRPTALVVACLYVVAPHHIDDFLRRFAYPELWGMALAPWVFWSACLAARTERFRTAVLLSVLLALTGLVHNLTAVMISVVLPVFWIFESGPSLRSLARLTGVLVGALALGAFYWVPAVADRGEILMSRQFADTAAYVANGLHPHHLLLPTGGGRLGLPSPSLWFVLLGAWGGAVLVREDMRTQGRFSRKALTLPLLCLVALLLSTKIGAALVHVIPPIRYLQFPWRFLALANLFLSVAAGGVVERCLAGAFRSSPTKWFYRSALAALLTGTVLFSFSHGIWDRKSMPTLREYETAMKHTDWPGDHENKYCLLTAAEASDVSHRHVTEPAIWSKAGQGKPELIEHEHETIRFAVDDAGPTWDVIVRRSFTRGWIADCPEGRVKIRPDRATGLIQVHGEQTRGTVTLRYIGTPMYRLGVWISILAAFAVLLLCGRRLLRWPAASRERVEMDPTAGPRDDRDVG